MKRILFLLTILLVLYPLWSNSENKSSTLNMVLNAQQSNVYDIQIVSDNQTNAVVNEYRFVPTKNANGLIISEKDSNAPSNLYIYWSIVSTDSFAVKLKIDGPLSADNIDEKIGVEVSWNDNVTRSNNKINSSSSEPATLFSETVSENAILRTSGYQQIDISLVEDSKGFLGYPAAEYKTNLIVTVESHQ